MRILTHIVTAQEDGATVKHLLRQRFALSSSLLKSIKWREGGITLNGVPVTVTALCHAGDRLAADVSDSPSQNPNLHPIDFPLSLLWEDEDLLILNKPAGITVHCAALTQEPVTVAGAVAHYLNSDQYHGVNRLDRGTTRGHGGSKIRVYPRPVHGPAPLRRFLSGISGHLSRHTRANIRTH